ncbi:MAG: PAS domain S-box-containing protein [Flavobacteriaceae bacterium]|jgi:PAS domain S-box-containing protein
MENSLNNQENLLANLLNDLPNVVLYQKESSKNFISENIKDMIGYTVAELMSKDNFIMTLIHDDDRNDILTEIGSFSSDSKRKILTLEYRMSTKNGGSIWVQDHIIKNIDEEIRKFTGVLLDVTERKNSEQLLQRSESRFRTLVENLTEGVLLLRDASLEYSNRSAQVLLGLSSEKDESLNLREWTLDPFKNLFDEALDLIKSGSFKKQVELKMIRPSDGEILDVELDGTLQEDGAIMIVLHDISPQKMLAREQLRAQVAEEMNMQLQTEISEREKAEQNLIRIQKYTNSIIQSSLDMIIATDNEDNISEFNPAAESIFGYSKEEILGKDIKMLFSDEEEMAEVLETIKVDGSFASEIVNKKKNNSLFITYLSSSILKDDDGNVVGSMGVSRDITALKKAEEELKLSEERHRAIYDQAYIGIARIAKIGRFLLVNERLCEMLGYTAEQMYIQTFYDLTLPVEVEESLKDWDALLNGELDNFSKEQTYLHKNGNQVSTNVTVSLVRDTKGNPNYYVAVFEEITERKAQERALKESLAEKEILLKEVHHRVKNNMQVITSILNLQSAYITDEAALQMLKESQDRIKSMSLVHESLYQSKILSQVNFSEYVTNICKNLYHSYLRPQGGIHLQFDLDDVHLNLDTSIPCGLILNELMSNAMKYAFLGKSIGVITVGLKASNGRLILTVTDDGVGLTEDFVIEESDSLGLQLVSTLVMQIGGILTIQKREPTMFTIDFKEQ